MGIQEKVQKVIEESFPGCQLGFYPSTSSRRVSGFLIWSGFDGLDQVDRQAKLWDILEQQLDAEVTRVLTIFTHTPDEYEAMMAA